MLCATPTPRSSISYTAPDPHRAPAWFPVACGEVRPSRDPYPVETALRRADALALSLSAALHRVAPALARAGAAFVDKRAWSECGYARLEDCARERFGRSGRWVRDLATLGRAFDTMPRLEAALAGSDGGRPLGQVEALLIARMKSPESVEAWIRVAREADLGHLKETVRRARAAGSVWPPGSEPAEGTVATGPDPAAGKKDAAGDDEDPDLEDRHLVRYLVPAPVAAAFDEALDLFRAVVGQESTVTSFVEALVGGSLAGAEPPDLEPDGDRRPLLHGETRAVVESALARSTNNWEHLPRRSDGSWALAMAGTTLRRLQRIAARAGQGGPADLDDQIRALAELEDEIKRRLGRLLAEMGAQGAWSRLRFAGAGHYAEQRLGLSRGAAQDRQRAAHALRPYRVVREAYEQGRLGLEAAKNILRILNRQQANEARQRALVDHAAATTIKRLRDEARFLRQRAALEPEGPAAGSGPAPCDDATWQASVRREPGTARKRIFRLGARAVESPMSDVFLRLRLPAGLAADFMACVESARRRLARLVEQVPWDQDWPDPDAPPSVLAARTFSIRCRRTPAWVGLLAMLEDAALTWDGETGAPRRPEEAIHRRDGYRCTAPGCTSRRRLQCHHVRYRSRRGGEEESNKTSVCEFHHLRGEHGGLARCRGRAPLGLVWRLGRGDLASWFRNEKELAGPM